MTKDDHELWTQHNLTDADACTLSTEQRTAFNRLPHLFAENAGAGERNGFEVGQAARRRQPPYSAWRRKILRELLLNSLRTITGSSVGFFT